MKVSITNQSPLHLFLKKNILYVAALIELVVFDHLSKYFAEYFLGAQKTIVIVPNYFSLSVSHNSAIAFSLPVSGKLVALFTPLLLAAIIIMVKNSFDTSRVLTKIALVLLCAGTIGNFIDRVWRGYVVDFLAPSFFPSFNLADAYLSIGVVILIAGYHLLAKTPELTA